MRRASVTGLAEVTGTPTGLAGLVSNKKCLGLALFASLGGVLYGYNQGVFGQVQVMADFEHRFSATVSSMPPLESVLRISAYV
ncbi:hypothetical protein AbraIFM66951_011291 [Aspergillus brasiliensis]|nr:hypothetical protein AbraIFM66951_011291 [Aspergillus brasiliensis]